jgi:hypothetical protein
MCGVGSLALAATLLSAGTLAGAVQLSESGSLRECGGPGFGQQVGLTRGDAEPEGETAGGLAGAGFGGERVPSEDGFAEAGGVGGGGGEDGVETGGGGSGGMGRDGDEGLAVCGAGGGRERSS